MGISKGTKTARYFRGTPEERFWHYTEIGPDHWIWTGSVLKDKEGNPTYGCLAVEGGRVQLAHRFSWELFHGRPVPEGLEIDHRCRIKLCVYFFDLEAVTRSINQLRGNNPEVQRAIHAARTHCLRGHPLSGDNIRFDQDGCRVCRTCMREHQRAYRKRMKEGQNTE